MPTGEREQYVVLLVNNKARGVSDMTLTTRLVTFKDRCRYWLRVTVERLTGYFRHLRWPRRSAVLVECHGCRSGEHNKVETSGLNGDHDHS